MRETGHAVQFYESDDFLVETVAAFCGDAMRAGDVAVVVATAAHREALEARLQAAGLDPAAACARGDYVALDAADTLARFMVDGMPDPGRFARTIGGLLADLGAGGRGLRVFGEMVALLAAAGNADAAVALEQCWEELGRQQAFSLLCAYPLAHFGGETGEALFHAVCAEHGRALPTERYLALATEDERLRVVAALQLQAHKLEAATAERQRVEERQWAGLAHELCNPLTALALHTQVALRRLDRDPHLEPARLEESLRGISSQTTRLSALVDRLLDAGPGS
jgi:signal transduction histidine kinase